jgi:CRISPR/Cas system-associated protein Cas10 (large subunit of type III CRISPR-Cas system)
MPPGVSNQDVDPDDPKLIPCEHCGNPVTGPELDEEGLCKKCRFEAETTREEMDADMGRMEHDDRGDN